MCHCLTSRSHTTGRPAVVRSRTVPGSAPALFGIAPGAESTMESRPLS